MTLWRLVPGVSVTTRAITRLRHTTAPMATASCITRRGATRLRARWVDGAIVEGSSPVSQAASRSARSPATHCAGGVTSIAGEAGRVLGVALVVRHRMILWWCAGCEVRRDERFGCPGSLSETVRDVFDRQVVDVAQGDHGALSGGEFAEPGEEVIDAVSFGALNNWTAGRRSAAGLAPTMVDETIATHRDHPRDCHDLEVAGPHATQRCCEDVLREILGEFVVPTGGPVEVREQADERIRRRTRGTAPGQPPRFPVRVTSPTAHSFQRSRGALNPSQTFAPGPTESHRLVR